MKPILKLTSIILLILGGLCGCQFSPQHESVPPSPAVSPSSSAPVETFASAGPTTLPDQLVALNKVFLNAYSERRSFVKSNTSPLIVADFSTLVLYRNGTAETNACDPVVYHALKAVAHVPFGIYLRLDPCTEAENRRLSEDVVGALRSYLEKIDAAESVLPDSGLSPEQLTRQHLILAQCKSYLNNVITGGTATRRDLLDFDHKVAPWMLANAADAAAAQLDLTHAVVMRWKRKIPPDEWKRLVVVLRGFQMPRRLNILTQYFARVLNEPGHGLGYPLESRRLIYAEFIMSNKDHLDLMATTFVDGDASEAFFGDRWRMSRDVLADGAMAHLKKLRFD